MAAAVGGDGAGMFAALMISLILVGVLFLYGAFIAYKGGKNKTSLALFIGTLQVVLGIAMYFVTAIVVYNNYGEATNITNGIMSLSFMLLALGSFVAAISFILYVKKHNKVV